jgi:hypothetical protein
VVFEWKFVKKYNYEKVKIINDTCR